MDYYNNGNRSRGFGGGMGGGEKLTFYIDQQYVGRVIGKGGSRIRDLQDESGCNIKIESQQCEREGQARVDLSGSEDAKQTAKSLIENLCCEGPRGGYRGGQQGGAGYGGRRDGQW